MKCRDRFTSSNDMSENKYAMNCVSKEIKESCLRLLALREHSQKELLNKLLVKGLARMTFWRLLMNWLNKDGRAIQDMRKAIPGTVFKKVMALSSLLMNFGKMALMRLFRRHYAEMADSWMEILEQVYIKKYGHDLLMDRNEWAKRSRFLMQRGFSGTMISALFDHLNIKL